MINNIEHVVVRRGELTNNLLDFVVTDCLLFVDDSIPKEDIVCAVDKVNLLLNTEYMITDALNVLDINKKQRSKLKQYFDDLSDIDFVKIYFVATELKSVLLAILLIENKISTDEAFSLSIYEEDYQQKKWGINEEIIERQNTIKARLYDICEIC